MADRGHELTDEMLQELEKQLKSEYERAAREVAKKYEQYMAKFRDDMAKQKALLDAGKITQKDYNDFVYRKTMTGRRWEQMQKTLAEDYHHANEIALGMSKNKMPDVYALNANYATYRLEHDAKLNTGLTLYNHDTAEYLMKEQRQLMPGPSTKKAAEIAANKDLQWNMQKIQSSVLQGVLQGESPYQVAARLTNVAQMNYNSAVRYARTMTTNAQNAGRYEAYRRADRLGVDLVIEWSATLDGKTRHDHRLMHGQRRKVDEPFILPTGQRILYPADSSGSHELQGEIWNCRCTLLSWVKGFEGDTVTDSPKMGGLSFEEWQNEKQKVASEATKSEEKYITRDYDSQIAKAVGVDYYDGVCNMLDGCANADVRDLYGAHINDVVVGSTTTGGAYQSVGKIYFDTASTAQDTVKRKQYSTFYHESGHAIDYRISREQGSWRYYSETWQNGKYGRTIKDEVGAIVDAKGAELKAGFKANRTNVEWLKANGFLSDFREGMLKQYCSTYNVDFNDILSGDHKITNIFYKNYVPSYSKSMAYSAVEKEIQDIIRSDGGNWKAHALSDIFEGATRGRIQAGWGHGKSYWDKIDVCVEAFAEMSEAYVSGPESLAVLKKWLPKSLQAYDDMIAEYMGGRR